MDEFVIPNKLVAFTKMCMEEIKYQERVNSTVSEAFIVETSLKQEDKLSSLLINLAVEKAVKMMQNEASGIGVNNHRVRILNFANY